MTGVAGSAWLRAPALIAALAIGWVCLAWGIGPPLVQLAYDGATGIAWLDGSITGQDVHPVTFYLERWQAFARGGLVLLLMSGVGTFVMGHPATRRRVERHVSAATVVAPTGLRRSVVHLPIIIILVGSAYDIIRFQEHWPFSRYAMYSRIIDPTTLQRYQAYGVPTNGEHPELRLDARAYLLPLDPSRLHESLRRVAERDDLADLRTAAQAIADLYARNQPRHGGPALAAVRIYRTTWRLDPAASNFETPLRRVRIATSAHTDSPDAGGDENE